MLPWTDRTGRFAPLKCAAFAGVLMPALWIVIEARFGWLGERPITEAIHQSGLWAVRLLAMTLAVTPARLALRWPKLISIRRILGVSVMAYALLHVALYMLISISICRMSHLKSSCGSISPSALSPFAAYACLARLRPRA